ncbi:MAG: serine/threonine protein kinase, partial [Deltaproteobacteria bacterium]|nr:serine/threonine protein kinase [Deltaproteobacteria bacterium]
MGAVYRARQHSVGRDVALKVVNPSLMNDPSTIKRFLREAKLASRLAHPNVVSVLDFGQTKDGLFYLVMELVAGRTLHQVLEHEPRLELPRVMRIALQICDALEGAHGMPIIHRDLKPANVMLLSAGRDLVKVLDFGLAKSLSIDTTASTMTSAGALLGTPTFMPPEVANGLRCDGRADLYSLGCMLYLMGSGRPPFLTDSVPEMIAMHGTQPAPPMAGVPAPMAAVIDRLLLKDPADRYQTAAELRNALEDAYESSRNAPILAAPPPPDEPYADPHALTMRSSDALLESRIEASNVTREGATVPYTPKRASALSLDSKVPRTTHERRKAISIAVMTVIASIAIVLIVRATSDDRPRVNNDDHTVPMPASSPGPAETAPGSAETAPGLAET